MTTTMSMNELLIALAEGARPRLRKITYTLLGERAFTKWSWSCRGVDCNFAAKMATDHGYVRWSGPTESGLRRLSLTSDGQSQAAALISIRADKRAQEARS